MIPLGGSCFPFSLVEEARQWYTRTIGSVNGNWGELRDKFRLRFYPQSRVVTLRSDIFRFQQNEKESIGVTWARFLLLMKSGPIMLIPDHVLLQHFYMGLFMDSASYLDITAGVFLPQDFSRRHENLRNYHQEHFLHSRVHILSRAVQV